MIIYEFGDILASDCDAVGHGCNCFNTMASGIAKQIRELFPEAWQADQNTLSGDKNKLGTVEIVECSNGTIINCYTQYQYKRTERCADYDAIRSCMIEIKDSFDPSLKIGFPKIGAGLAGGDWNVISRIIEEVFDDRNVYVYCLAVNDDRNDPKFDISKYKDMYKNIYNK
jgi:O-acetyl-ADP-ribose deacetylase (regulator of RNase III)